MTSPIIPQKIYPIGEFPDGHQLCASVQADREVDWFPGHRDFDIPENDDDLWVITFEDDDVPTLTDAQMHELMGDNLPFYREGWN